MTQFLRLRNEASRYCRFIDRIGNLCVCLRFFVQLRLENNVSKQSMREIEYHFADHVQHARSESSILGSNASFPKPELET